ncbi:unnamed protein product, partial [marine sediment metagenome]
KINGNKIDYRIVVSIDHEHYNQAKKTVEFRDGKPYIKERRKISINGQEVEIPIYVSRLKDVPNIKIRVVKDGIVQEEEITVTASGNFTPSLETLKREIETDNDLTRPIVVSFTKEDMPFGSQRFDVTAFKEFVRKNNFSVRSIPATDDKDVLSYQYNSCRTINNTFAGKEPAWE